VVFGGESEHTLDPKNRFCVPKRFQDELDRSDSGHLTCVLTRGFDGCLFLFSESGFQQVLARLQTQPFVGREQRKMQRLFFSNTYRAQLDSSGRLLVPEKLKKIAGLDREVVLVGVADRAEIWSKSAWQTFESEASGDFDDLDGVLCGDPAAIGKSTNTTGQASNGAS
jgi:MraZ protein